MKLNQKILLGYVLLLLIICSMVGVIVYERQRMRNIEMEVSEIRQIRRDINTAHRHITRLALLGEGVIGWNDTDYRNYHNQRLHTDSLLRALKPHCMMYVHPEQIDTLCNLLSDKELHLRHIMEAIEQQGEADASW